MAFESVKSSARADRRAGRRAYSVTVVHMCLSRHPSISLLVNADSSQRSLWTYPRVDVSSPDLLILVSSVVVELSMGLEEYLYAIPHQYRIQ